MSDYRIIDTNADNISGCSLCGNKIPNNLGHRRKANWLKERYAEGLKYKVLRSDKFGDIGMKWFESRAPRRPGSFQRPMGCLASSTKES